MNEPYTETKEFIINIDSTEEYKCLTAIIAITVPKIAPARTSVS
jgi:hypothetical protein